MRKAHSFFHPREGGVDIAVDGLAYTVSVRQEFPQSTDPDRSSRLVVELAHGLTDRPGRWRDRKTRTLEEALGPVLGEIEVRAAQDARRRQYEQQAIVEREVRWRAAVEWRKNRLFANNLPRYYAKRPGAKRSLLPSARTARHWNVVLASFTALWTSRL
ncbi:hypothetical protein [Streptomyces sp. NPDC005322]|uniref:hypothetical protein n=1 Tax=Streptomyces sp. NPDC005322 TaxID=3157032 RepID=UPI0033B16E07